MNTKHVVCLALATAVGTAFAEGATPRMDRSRLLVGSYCLNPCAYDEAHVRDIAACGVDFMIGIDVRQRKLLDLFAKHGVGVVANGVLPGWWGGDGAKAGQMREKLPRASYEKRLDEYLRELDHPAIWMIDLCDEPSALDMPYLGETSALIARRAPQTPAYLNLYPNYASVSQNTGDETVCQLGTKTYREHIDVYCRTVPLDYISYDFYVYTPNRAARPTMLRKMYDNFNIVADACRRTGRSFWYIPQVNSYEAVDFEPTSVNRLRFQAYTAMAFGAEVISWACWMKGWWTNNVLTVTGEKTEQYEKLRAMNAELHRLGPDYMRHRNVGTHYVGFAATNGFETLGVPLPKALDTGFFMGLKTAEGTPLVVGELVPRDGKGSSRALFVVASGDPWDDAPARRTVVFRVAEGFEPRVLGGRGIVKVARAADGSWSFPLAECDGALVTAVKIQ